MSSREVITHLAAGIAPRWLLLNAKVLLTCQMDIRTDRMGYSLAVPFD